MEPYAFPRDVATLLRVALKRGADVNYHLAALPGLAGSLARYWAASHPLRHARISRDYAALIEHSTSEHHALATLAGADDLLRREGYRWVFRTEAALQEAARRAGRLAASHGLRHAVLDGAQLAGPGCRMELDS